MQKFCRLLLIAVLWFSLFFVQKSNNKTYHPPSHYWNITELKGLDPIDSKSSIDLVAFYLRQTKTEIQIRVDYIGVFDPNNQQIILKTNSAPEKNFVFPQDSEPETNFYINPIQNYIIIKLPLNIRFYSLHIELIDIKGTIIDKTAPFSKYTSSPNPIKANLVFTNTQLGFTPAQILRNWDGAHNGPNGQRFGLKNLIGNSQLYQIPIVLADFYTPANLAALKLLGQQGLIENPAQYQFLTIYQPNSPDSNWVYDNLPNYSFPIGNFSPRERDHDYFIETGLSNQTLVDIINSFYSGKNELIFKISFPHSIISDYSYSPAIFDFLKNHPWLEFSSIAPKQSLHQIYPNNSEAELNAINFVNKMKGPFTDDAKLFLSNYFSSKNLLGSEDIFSQYQHMIYYLDTANQWVNNSDLLFTCDQDIDLDGNAECIIQNEIIFTLIEPQNNYIPLMAIKNEDGDVFPIIGSSAFIGFGLSPQQEWVKDQGIKTDPRVYPGLTGTNTLNEMEIINIDQKRKELILENSETKERVTIQLNNDNLTINFVSEGFNNQIIFPILLNMKCKYSNDWIYQSFITYSLDNHNQTYQCGKFNFNLKTNGNIMNTNIFSPSQLITEIRKPENPDMTYPPIHYLPVGLAIQEINFSDNLTIEISASD